MKIREFFISGFGIFSGVRVESLSDRLNVFVGNNEAGKSTLLAFFRAILFGFETSQSRENRYEPLADVEHGGIIKLTLDRTGADYTIRRRSGRAQGVVEVTMPDGGTGGEEVIGQLLPGVTRDLHRSVFAFSLDELQRLDTLKGEDVRSRIYSGGAGVGQVTAVDVEKRLDAEMSALFLPRAARPKINALVAEIDAAQSELKGLSAASADYDKTRAQLDSQTQSIESAGQTLARLQGEIVHLEQMEKAWPSWELLFKTNASLALIPEIGTFPADGIGRLERCREKIDDASRKLDLKRVELEAERNQPVAVVSTRRIPIKPAALIVGVCLIALSAAFRQNTLAAAAFGLLGLVAAGGGFWMQANLDSSEKSRRAELMLVRDTMITKISRELDELDHELRQAREELSRLLHAGGAADEEDFRLRWSDYSKQMQLKNDIARLESDIELIAGRGKGKALTSELASTDPATIKLDLARKHEELNRLNTEMAELLEHKGRLSQKIAEMEQSDELSAALLHNRTLRAQLDMHASEWAIKAICKSLLRQTRQKYEREKQPRVIRSASNYLSEITSGAYAKIFSPLGREEVELETPEGMRKDVSKLSRGTREQLYLALRFGLIREYGLSAEPLPVIMDDILVNFDPARSQAAARAIIGLTKSNQILFFTCHSEIADLFANLDASVSRFVVHDGGIA